MMSLFFTIALIFASFPALNTQFIRDRAYWGPWDYLDTIHWSDLSEPSVTNKPSYIFTFFDEIQKHTCLKFQQHSGILNQTGLHIIIGNWNVFNPCTKQGRTLDHNRTVYLTSNMKYKDTYHHLTHWLAIGDSNLRRNAGDYIERTNNEKPYNLSRLSIDDYLETPIPYDLGGLMHMPCDERTQCRPKDKNKIFSVSNNMLVWSDYRLINMAYGCHWICSIDAYERCYFPNKGLPDSRNCESCICPDGFEGPECTDRRKELGANGPCGDTLTATNQEQILNINLPKPSQEGKPNACIYHIQAPESKQVVVEMIEFNPQGPSASADTDQKCIEQCMKSYIEVQTERFDLTGPRFCCKYAYEQKKIDTLKSKDGLIVIKVNSYHEDTNAKISYKVVD